MGRKGRFRLQLINRIARAGKRFDDTSISPVMRQVRNFARLKAAPEVREWCLR